ncbi:hypothetical protein BDU57DRAFT_152359 [Ampelomyces quisqualis]|uniref:Rhodopsin domain-containing protein n=1 Tax=Ampelomyces quisqualis TaxID=50730 RepID=A0A6A5QY36_AMPQU|nr:hypothetical protein BDU57DRAFT_152359 [Ampelomyces quisqualis]
MEPNRGPDLQAVCSTFVTLAFMATALRIYVRTCLVRAFGWDDFFMVLALFAHIMFATCAIGGIKWGTGRHMATLSNEEIFMAMRYWWLCYIGYCLAMITSKISIGLFLLRVTIKPIQKWIIYGAMTVSAFTGAVFFLVTVFQCTPISYFWNARQKGYCVPIDVIIGLTFLYSACAIISDFTFAILPIFLVWGLNMPTKTRMMLIPILSMACVASIAVTVRLAYVMDFKDPDFLWATVDVAIWSDIEQGLAITAGSTATLRPLFRKFASTLGLSTGTPDENSKPSGMRTPQWSPQLPGTRRKFPSFKSILRSEKGTVRERDDEYGMGDLRPVRLRDDLVNASASEKSNNGSNSWEIQVGETSDEYCRPGAITMHTQVHQASERQL